ncbi:hypothetical protein TVAG_436910 [Trichomonas vaginalis G3]|uniref:Uncharacterized protein n=1 Tax=Trichomonas vaginalis (strain ATCC PRA-98 / G3) TaxID=412133 RepID=A2DFD9_TRIV3|nr:Ankyrin repeat family [Trichomonas vaginalis G3]EAY20867.1 hypothetical protein TVAG_436910 [Trichomonas vaginalis G3]KAI5521523.1 Ankyrin repeat family [Trichomonas vaginalis G3]|eukprot:XP_001581853.1 hypothetical protein [Trichomonas vaginalis G3]
MILASACSIQQYLLFNPYPIISFRSSINEKDNYGKTALQTSAANNHKEAVELPFSLTANND